MPGVEFVDIDFWDDGDRAWFGHGLVSEIVDDEFFVGRMKSETWRERRIGIYFHDFRTIIEESNGTGTVFFLGGVGF